MISIGLSSSGFPGHCDISSRYDPALAGLLRSLPSRIWDKSGACWRIPIGALEESLQILRASGQEVKCSKGVTEILFARKTRREEAERIKSGEYRLNCSLPLFEFQRHGAAWMKAVQCGLNGGEMGTGKSLQTIAALQEVKGKALITVPKTLMYSWKSEIEKWIKEPLIFLIQGSKKKRIEIYDRIAQSPDCYCLIGYEILRIDIEYLKKL